MLLDAVGGRPHRGAVELPTRLVVRGSTLAD
jgi:LacI family transcriptional regulator